MLHRFATYKELQTTQEYALTGAVVIASDCVTKETLALCVSGGGINEAFSTHEIGWELQRLAKSRETNSNPFNFLFLVVGYKNKDKNSLPVKEVYRQLGIDKGYIN